MRPGPRSRTLEDVIRDDAWALWAEPRVPDPPRRVWRDWALLAACLLDTVLEGTLRPDLVWRPLAVLFALFTAVLPLWRRAHPLGTVVAAFGGVIGLQLVTLLAGPSDPIGLYSSAVVLVLVYALPRWGSGRDIVLGTAVLLPAYALSALLDRAPLEEQIGGFVFLMMPGVIGASVRFRSTSRRRELERLRLRERERLARELHDTVAHHVSAMVIRAQAGRVVAATDPEAAVEALLGIEEEGARTLEAMRAMVVALRERGTDAELAPRTGVADLRRLVHAPGGGLRVELSVDGGAGSLPPALDAAVYRIVQESVTNAMRHAVGATRVEVGVVADDRAVRVRVRDDGAPPGHARGRSGYGLIGLRERADLLGGVLRAGPGEGGGWVVEAELPRDSLGNHADPRARR